MRPRAGFTLMEMLLVLAIMVAVGAMALPEMQGPLAMQRLKSAAEQVRAAWNNARSSAMQTGEIHLFRYELDTGEYSVQRWANADTSSAATTGGSTASDTIHTLPDEVVFHDGGALAESSRDLAAKAEIGASGASGSAPSVLFYADGTTSNSILEIENKQETRIRVSLRGLTGVVTVSDPYATGDAR